MAAINPSRLILARKTRGLSKRELAARAEVSIRSLDSYVSGDRDPSETHLSRLAQVLDFPIEFFDGPDLDEPAASATNFRAFSRLPARNIDQANAWATLA